MSHPRLTELLQASAMEGAQSLVTLCRDLAHCIPLVARDESRNVEQGNRPWGRAGEENVRGCVTLSKAHLVKIKLPNCVASCVEAKLTKQIICLANHKHLRGEGNDEEQ